MMGISEERKGEKEDVVEGDDDIALGPVPPKAGGLAPTTAIQEIYFFHSPGKNNQVLMLKGHQMQFL